MSFYARHVVPRLTDLAMRRGADTAQRARFVPQATGRVLEVGVGSALNVPFYGPDVTALWGLDPSLALWRIGRRRLGRLPFPLRFIAASAERIPLRDASVETVVSTWTLCTIPDPAAALAEMRRVLTPDGRFVFVEHGRAPDPSVQRWQDRLAPLWRRVSGGCHLDRPIDALVVAAGFRLDELERGYGRGPRPLDYLYKGRALC
jgi:ubiquinone/menaquinone biosynthesis C-methylase UbiE